MISTIISLATEFWPVLLGAAGFAWGAYQKWQGRRQGRQEAEQEAMTDANERVEKGRQAVSRGRERGTPDERVRENDGRW